MATNWKQLKAIEANAGYHAKYDAAGVWLSKYDSNGNTDIRTFLKWEEFADKEWRAVGAKGSFFIEKSGRLYWSRYTSTSGLKTFRMPPKQKVSDAKAMCEENQYWEEEEKC